VSFFYDLGKRILDIIGGIVGILVFFPVMFLAAVYIKVVSPEGPVLADIPERLGKGGKKFKMLKFRSMIPNAHEWLISHPEIFKKYKENNYKLDDDPRWIKGAKFIRRTSIDELPQFFNVLMGDMSLVGPRAYYPFEIEDQLKKHPEAKKYVDTLLSTKPGLSGVWQTSGRSEISFVDRVKMDAEYAKRKSLLYDLQILSKTPWVVLFRKGAF